MQIIFKHLPLSMHKRAPAAHAASEAAHRQGKFWEMHDLIFANQRKLDQDTFFRLRRTAGSRRRQVQGRLRRRRNQKTGRHRRLRGREDGRYRNARVLHQRSVSPRGEAEKSVRIVWKHLPLSMHAKAPAAHAASEAAHIQGKFWEMHDQLHQGRTL